MRRSKPAGLFALARALTRCARPIAVRRALPLYGAIGIASAIIFSPNGMSAADVTLQAGRSWPFRAALWAGWLLITAPVAHPLLALRPALFLRSLPIPRWQFAAVSAAHLAIAEGPFFLLWSRGSGLAAGCAAASVAVSAHALSALPRRRLRDLPGAIPLLLAIAWADAPPWLLVAAAAVAARAGLERAWQLAPEVGSRARRGGRSRAPRPAAPGTRRPSTALARVYIAALFRREQTSLWRATLAIAIGAGAAALAVRNNRLADTPWLIRTPLAIGLGAFALGFLQPMRLLVDLDRRHRAFFAGLGAAPRVRLVAAALAVGALAVPAGLVYGALVGFIAGADLAAALALPLLTGAWAAALVALLAGFAWVDQRRVAVGARSASPVLGAICAGLFAAALSAGRWAVPLAALAAALLFLIAMHPGEKKTRAEGEPMILRVRDLWKAIGRRSILCGVDLDCAAGEVIAVRGQNGSGKSTLLKAIVGVLVPDRGTIALDDAPVGSAELRAHVGYVPEADDPMAWLTAGEWLALVAHLKAGRPPPPELLAALGVDELRTKRVGALSLGQLRRVYLVGALIGDPWLLILDEPTNGLDAESAATLANLADQHRRRGGAALLATHDAAFAAAVATRQVVIREGRIEAWTADPE